MRPISLTNIDYRIMAKAIYNRMATVMSDLVGRWQKCSIPGRKIDSILIQIRDIIEDANRSKEKKKLFITAIDQWKAFDSISHQYILKMIKHANLGVRITKLVESIYDILMAIFMLMETILNLLL